MVSTNKTNKACIAAKRCRAKQIVLRTVAVMTLCCSMRVTTAASCPWEVDQIFFEESMFFDGTIQIDNDALVYFYPDEVNQEFKVVYKLLMITSTCVEEESDTIKIQGTGTVSGTNVPNSIKALFKANATRTFNIQVGEDGQDNLSFKNGLTLAVQKAQEATNGRSIPVPKEAGYVVSSFCVHDIETNPEYTGMDVDFSDANGGAIHIEGEHLVYKKGKSYQVGFELGRIAYDSIKKNADNAIEFTIGMVTASGRNVPDDLTAVIEIQQQAYMYRTGDERCEHFSAKRRKLNKENHRHLRVTFGGKEYNDAFISELKRVVHKKQSSRRIRRRLFLGNPQ